LQEHSDCNNSTATAKASLKNNQPVEIVVTAAEAHLMVQQAEKGTARKY